MLNDVPLIVRGTDPELAELLDLEARRQSETLSLIPSENHVSAAVLAASGTVLTNKYSEGYPGKRYYEGQQIIDRVEALAIERARRLFGVEHANVQPYSGSPANLAVYLAFLEPGDTVMGMALPMGGHLTHGWNVSITGKWFRAVQYGVDRATGRVDLDEVRRLALEARGRRSSSAAAPRSRARSTSPPSARSPTRSGALLVADIAHIAGLVAGGAHPSPAPFADVITTTTHKTLRGPRGAMLMSRAAHAAALDRAVFPGLQGGPHNHTTAAIAVSLHEAATAEFRQYAQQIVANAQALADTLLEDGFDLVSGGTDNHLILMDLTRQGVPGKVAAKALDRAGLTANYNTVPYDTRKPFDPSGLRLGTPAVTTRGMKEAEMRMIGRWLRDGIDAARRGDEETLTRIRAAVRELGRAFPVPGV